MPDPGPAPAPPDAPPTLVLVRDLIFATKISGTAAALGVAVQMLRDPAKLRTDAGPLPGHKLIVDLNMEGAIEAASAWRAVCGAEVVGFVSHVDAAAIERARDAGITSILPRSRFVQVLPELLRPNVSAVQESRDPSRPID